MTDILKEFGIGAKRADWRDECPKCGSENVGIGVSTTYLNLFLLTCRDCKHRWNRVHSASASPFPEKLEEEEEEE